MTTRYVKAVCSKLNERIFVIQCVIHEYEKSNTTIRARHQKLFKDDTYEFEASKELVIDGLKDKKWTHIDKKWLARLMKHLKKAQSSNIKQIRFIRHIWRLDIYDKGNLSKNRHPMISSLSGPHSWLYLPTNLTRKMLLREPHQKGFKWRYPWSSWKLIFEIVACHIPFFEIRIQFFWYS